MDIKIKAIKPIENEIIKPISLFQPKEANEEAVTRRLNKITAKLKSGKRLTGDEKIFLLKHSPGLYQTAKKVEMQRTALKNQLEHARSKEEVNEIVGTALSSVSKKDPDMEYVVAAIQDEAKTFRATNAYKKLPATKKDAKKNAYHPYDEERKNEDSGLNSLTTSGLYGADGKYL